MCRIPPTDEHAGTNCRETAGVVEARLTWPSIVLDSKMEGREAENIDGTSSDAS